MTTFRLNVNGRQHSVDADSDTPLLYVLRDDLKLNGAKFGCGLGQCGSCTVLLDKEVVLSCLVPVSTIGTREVRTVESLANGALHRAFVDEQAAQCGYCIAGMMVRAQALLERGGTPSATEIRCRCGTHMRIVRAIERALHEGRPA
jgi:nicotinate dehydrogenase subunit A